MSYLLSIEQLNSIREDILFYSSLNESYIARQRKADSQEITVFLSHKHSDRIILENVIGLLKGLGVNIYVDWNDLEMPSTTSGYTAMRIKEKIKECKKFILLATEDAIASKWCNWELGFGDAHKCLNNIAIMPITNKRGSPFSGSEYLQIYPVIKSNYAYILTECFVEYAGKQISLIDWLKQ